MSDIKHECLDCKMKFDSSEQLANHVKKFCVNSEYGNMKRLDDKYEKATQRRDEYVASNARAAPKIDLQTTFSMDQVRPNMKVQEPEFKQLEDVVQRRTEDQMLEQLEQMKQQRQFNRATVEQDEQIYLVLVQESEMRRERDFQGRSDREMIRKQISDMDSWRMSVIEEHKKKELEKLMGERDSLKLDLLKDTKVFKQMSKIIEALLSASGKTGVYAELKQKMMALHNRREAYEIERQRIVDNLERIKLGDLGEVRRTTHSRVGQSLLDQSQIEKRGHHEDIAKMRDKIAADTNRIDQLKQDLYNRPKTNDPQYSDKVLKDLQVLKDDYAKAGGNDPGFVQTLENLVKFYKNGPPQPDQPMANSRAVSRQQTANYQPQQQQQPIVQYNQQVQLPQTQYAQYDQSLQMLAQQQQELYRNQQQQLQMNAQARKKKPKEIDFNDPFDNFSRKKEFFLQNETRGVDLTREEQILLSLTAQEVDSLRQISRIPIGTELYRFKMEQYKELSTMRAEIEKIIQEQRLQKLRRNFEKKRRDQDRQMDNNKWVDDNRKFIIDQRLRRDVNIEGDVVSEQRLYDPSEGLVFHCDYILGLPRRTRLCQVVYAAFNNTTQLYSPKLIEPVDCEIESAQSNRVIIGESNQLYDIPPHPEALLILEIQFPYSKKLEENVGKTESFAWTMIDMFDPSRQLKRGMFRCPLYLGPTDPTITVEEIQKLEPIPNAWFHLRITFPNDDDFEQVRSIYPEQTQQEYNIPHIHLRGLFARNYELSIKNEVQPQRGDVTIGGQDYKVYEDVQTFERKQQSSGPVAQGPVIEIRNNRGIRFIVHQVINHVTKNQMRVMAAALFDNNLLLDREGLPVAFNTTIHDPASNIQGKGRENDSIPLVVANPEYEGMSNKSNRSNIITFHEEYRVFYDLIGVAQKAQKPIYLGFQVVESSGQDNNISSTMNGFEMIAWTFIQLINPQGAIQVGRQAIQLLQPPFRKPPFDPSQVVQSKIRLDYSVYDFTFDENARLEWQSSKKF